MLTVAFQRCSGPAFPPAGPSFRFPGCWGGLTGHNHSWDSREAEGVWDHLGLRGPALCHAPGTEPPSLLWVSREDPPVPGTTCSGCHTPSVSATRCPLNSMGHPALLFLTVLLVPRSPGSRAAAQAGAPLVVLCGTPVGVTHTAPDRAQHHPRVLWGLLGSSLPWPCILQAHTAPRRGMKCLCSPKPPLHIQQGRRLRGFSWHLNPLPTESVLKAK